MHFFPFFFGLRANNSRKNSARVSHKSAYIGGVFVFCRRPKKIIASQSALLRSFENYSREMLYPACSGRLRAPKFHIFYNDAPLWKRTLAASTFFRRYSGAFPLSLTLVIAQILTAAATIASAALPARAWAESNAFLGNESAETASVWSAQFWTTTPFLVGLGIVGALCLYLWRVRRIKRRQDALERTIQERTAELSARAEEIKRQNDILVSLNTEKNEFLGIAAHDLKNPLTSIILSASIIQQYHSRMTPVEIHEQTDHILITARRMQETILNLLDINAIESGRFKFNPIAMNMVEVVNDVVEGYYLRAKDKEISLHFNHDRDEIMMMCDRTALMQVLENIVSNAIKYSPLGKNVFVSVSVSCGDDAPTLFEREDVNSPHQPLKNRHVRVEIQDEGPGLTPEDKQLLFQKFAKLSAKPTGGEHSTGLGLSIVKKIVEAMEGQVWCDSEPGKGARFIIELPIIEPPAELLLERYS
jgi:signal transduction histidine kinase